MRALMIIVTLALVFGGGFFVGTLYQQDQIAENPELCVEIIGKKLTKDAGEQLHKLKDTLLGD